MRIGKIFFIVSLFIILIRIDLCAYASEYQSEVKVGLKYGSNASNSFKVSSVGGLNVYNAESGELLGTTDSAQELNITLGNSGLMSEGMFGDGKAVKISAQPQNGATVICDGKEYRGYIYAERNSGGELVVINVVGTDDYVKGVIGKEMSHAWPLEALKAQAICARNFVLCRGSIHRSYGFDVCTTTHCQSYGGVASEYESTNAAVNATKGMLGKYGGKVVSLYFYASNGGKSADCENVWGSPFGYLKSVDDPYENPSEASYYTWTTTLTRTQIQEKLKAAGASVGELLNVTIDETSEDGCVKKMTYHGTGGDYSVKLEKCRTLLGLKSPRFTLSASGGIVTTSGTAQIPLCAISGDNTVSAAALTAIDGSGVLCTVNTQQTDDDTYVINGSGYGHLVGMSQWGAKAMAEQGYTFMDILKYYYTDIALE